MKDEGIVEVKPIESIGIELNQLVDFYEDLALLEEVSNNGYWSDFKKLRDETDRLRSEYSSLYSRILSEHPDWKVYLEG